MLANAKAVGPIEGAQIMVEKSRKGLYEDEGFYNRPKDFSPPQPHTHVDKHGFLVECYHSTKNVLFNVSFWLGVTLSFPLEHWLYEKVWPFTILTKFLGL